jgi:hypothetical protein
VAPKEGKREHFLKYMATLGELFDKQISESMLELYWEILKDFSEQEIMKVFNLAGRHCKFFPKPAELLEILEGDKQDQAVLAWEKVYKATSSIGAYESVQFDDPVIHSCIKLMGGWVELCRVKTDEMKWKQKEFEKLYSVFSQRSSHPKYLVGITEHENSMRGFNVELNPKIIGRVKGELPNKIDMPDYRKRR